jgi:phenylalanyl-tRNA synthetase beta chain
MGAVLSGLGFFEAVTYSFTTRKRADLFLPTGMTRLEVDASRRGDEHALRPSILTGLLACRARNQESEAVSPGGVRLYEVAAVFAQHGGREVENVNLGLLVDAPGWSAGDLQRGVRLMRGAVDALVSALAGPGADLGVHPSSPHAPAFDPGAYAGLTLGGRALGYMGVVSQACAAAHGLKTPTVGCEVNVGVLCGGYPPVRVVAAPPAFPGMTRDLTLDVSEAVRWSQVESAVREVSAAPFEGVSFVTAYRGPQAGPGRKSVTIRLRYRAEDRTLRREDGDAHVAVVRRQVERALGATVREGPAGG